jgi:hypothetical protein
MTRRLSLASARRFLLGFTCALLLHGAQSTRAAATNFDYESLAAIDVDVRTLGMGGARTSNGRGAAAASSNPALLGLEGAASFVALPSTEWPIEDMSLRNYALAVPLWAVHGRRPVLGISYRGVVFDGIAPTAIDPANTSFRLESWSTLVNAGIAITPRFSAGGAVRITDLGDHDNRYAFDVGILLHRPLFDASNRTLEGRLGVVVRNMGTNPHEELPVDGADVFERVGSLAGAPSPEEFALAAGATHEDGWWDAEATFELGKPIYPNASPKWYQHYGGELEVLDVAAVRLGYVNDRYSHDVTYGFGVHVPVQSVLELSLDYARRPDPYEGKEIVHGARMDFWSFGVAYLYP